MDLHKSQSYPWDPISTAIRNTSHDDFVQLVAYLDKESALSYWVYDPTGELKDELSPEYTFTKVTFSPLSCCSLLDCTSGTMKADFHQCYRVVNS